MSVDARLATEGTVRQPEAKLQAYVEEPEMSMPNVCSA